MFSLIYCTTEHTIEQLTDHLINKEILLKMRNIKIFCEETEEVY